MWTPLALSVALALALTLAEFARGGRKWSSRTVNVQAWILVVGAQLSFLPLVALSVPFSLIEGGPEWLMVPLYFLAMDAGEYLFHRAQHAFPLLWRMHSLHHSDEDMNATTTMRHFWGDALVKALTIWPLAALIVNPTPLGMTLLAFCTAWNFVTHSGLRLDFGRWSWLLNCPAYHRRHHSALPEHYNSNFAGFFPIFDVIGGTYFRADGYPPTGLDERPRDFVDVALWPVRGIRERLRGGGNPVQPSA